MNKDPYQPTRVDVNDYGKSTNIAGPAWAVVVIIALLGMIWIASKSLDIAGSAAGGVERRPPPIVERSPGPSPTLSAPNTDELGLETPHNR